MYFLIQFVIHSESRRRFSTQDHTSKSNSFVTRSKAEEDRDVIEGILAHQGPCLLDCIELVLSEVDVFSARKKPSSSDVSLQDGYQYSIERDVSLYHNN